VLRVQRLRVDHLTPKEHSLLYLCDTREIALCVAKEWIEAEHRFGCCVANVRCFRVRCENDCHDATLAELDAMGFVHWDSFDASGFVMWDARHEPAPGLTISAIE
jgi:hypothetical protein